MKLDAAPLIKVESKKRKKCGWTWIDCVISERDSFEACLRGF